MTLSIITINLNNIEGLSKTIDSVRSQSFTDYEWIVIDGGSTDGSKELIENNINLFAYWVSEPDKGIYNAINKGIAHASGEYIQILNSGDVFFESTTLESLFKQNLDADINYGDALLHYPDGSVIDKHYPDLVSLNYFIHDVINHQATFFKRNVFEGHLYNEGYLIASDWAYCIEAVCRGLTFKHIKQTIVHYDNSGISSQWGERQISERQDIIDRYIPTHLKSDMAVLADIAAIRRRKSTRFIYDNTLCLCRWMNRFFNRIKK